MADWYLWFKVIHVLAVFAWMAGLFYLPRLFVYHVDAVRDSDLDKTFRIMERRLLHAIMNPAAAVSWLFGLATAWSMGWWEIWASWLWLKVGLVSALTVFHLFLARCQAAFARGENKRDARFFRISNEVPTLLLIGIVILVVAKPFA